MLIIYNESRKRFEAQTTYAERNEANPLLKKAGFSFDFDGAKVWHSQSYPRAPQRTWQEQIAVAARLSDYLDPAARTLVGGAADAAKAAQALAVASLEASRATDADIDIPRPQGLEYLAYQKAGIAYALKRQNTLIADEMGLGKTIQAIGVSNADANAKHILIICPAKLKLNWMKEFVKWDVHSRTVAVVTKNSGKARKAVEKYGHGRATIITKDGPFTADVVIANYEVVSDSACADKLRAEHWHTLIVDECHKVKNPSTIRTQTILGKYSWNKKLRCEEVKVDPLTAHADRRIFMTGTPIVNRPAELWPLIKVFDPQSFGGIFFWTDKMTGEPRGFAGRYCGSKQVYIGGGKYAWDHTGATNLPELQENLRTKFMVRRLKADVLKELPAKRRQIIVLESEDDMDELLKRESEAFDKLTADGLSYEDIPFTAMSAIRQEVAIAKLPAVIEFVNDILENADKIVVFAHHKAVINRLKEECGDVAVSVNGESTDLEMLEAAERFQTDPSVKVFIGSIIAAGVGITLTAASTVIFAEMDWVPGNNTQAEDRCHRIGQHDGVNVYYLVLDDSVDARIIELVLEKQTNIDIALDNKIPEKTLPAVAAPAPKKTFEQKAEEENITIDQATAKAIHNALRYLAERCDGAFAIDGQGFNKLDTTFGKKLAYAIMLTPKQAAAGQKLVRKYQRQLSPEMLQAAGVEPKEE